MQKYSYTFKIIFFNLDNGERLSLYSNVILKSKGLANPYNPEWENYFECRMDKQTEDSLKSRKRMFSLWKKQTGLCQICQQRINEQTKWHKHHIIQKIDGGKDTLTNLILLHPNCDRQSCTALN